MADEHERAGEGFEGFLQHGERGQVEVVGRLVEDQKVGGLEHEPGERDPRLLAAGESPDVGAELLLAKQKLLGPAHDVHGAVAVAHEVGVRRERLPERQVLIDARARLIEPDRPQILRPHDLPRVGLQIAGDQPQKRGLSAAVRADQPELQPRREEHVDVFEERPAAERLRDAVERDQLFRPPPRPPVERAFERRWRGCCAGSARPAPRSSRRRPRSRPLALVVRAFAPRLSHAISRRTSEASATCCVRLRREVGRALLQEIRVATLGGEAPFGVTRVQLDDPTGDVLQENNGRG